MNLPLYIAKRYLFSRKSHNVINIISLIAMVGIGVGALALVVVMSAFNGLDHLVKDLYTSFDPDIRITATEGKVFALKDLPETALRDIDEVEHLAKVLEEEVFFQFDGKQAIAKLKGVDKEFLQVAELEDMIYDGSLTLEFDNRPFAVLGYGVAANLQLYVNQSYNLLKVYAAVRGANNVFDPTKKFKQDVIEPAGVFATNTEADMTYVLVPLSFARNILDYPESVSAVELKLKPGAKADQVREKIAGIMGEGFTVKTRYQLNELLYKTNATEKWITYLILTFILVIATFNLIGSITMIIIDKREDIQILKSLGATKSMVRKAFLLEGLLISLLGGIGGLVLGLLLCGAQQWIGLVRLENALVEFYPIRMNPMDFLAILATVLVLGYLSSWLPSRIATNRYFA